MDLIYAAMNPYHIENLKKQLDKAEIKNAFRVIDEQCLITLIKYQNIKIDEETMHKSNYMGLGDRVQSQRDKINNKTNADTLRHLQKPGTPEGHRSIS